MSPSALLLVIAIGTVVIVGVAVTGFVIFSRFLRSDKEKEEWMRAVQRDLSDEPKRQ